MPNYEVEMTHTDTATRKTWLRSVKVMDVPQAQAIPMGINELLKWCEEESRTNPDIPISPKAYEYWATARQTGGQLYEIQSNLEQFGLTFGIKPIEEAPPAPKLNGRTSRNGTTPAKPQAGNGKMDFNTVLKSQLEYLQERQKEVRADLKTLQAEFVGNQQTINQISQFLLLSQPKKRGKKGAEAEQN